MKFREDIKPPPKNEGVSNSSIDRRITKGKSHSEVIDAMLESLSLLALLVRSTSKASVTVTVTAPE